MGRRGDSSTDEAVETLLFVEFLDGKPHSVVTTEATYDVCWSKGDEWLYRQNSGK